MVALIQKILQLYAGRALRTLDTEGAEGALNQVRVGLTPLHLTPSR